MKKAVIKLKTEEDRWVVEDLLFLVSFVRFTLFERDPHGYSHPTVYSVPFENIEYISEYWKYFDNSAKQIYGEKE